MNWLLRLPLLGVLALAFSAGTPLAARADAIDEMLRVKVHGLLGYLQELRTSARPGPLKPRLAQAFLSPDEALQRHLAEMDATAPSAAAAQP